MATLEELLAIRQSLEPAQADPARTGLMVPAPEGASAPLGAAPAGSSVTDALSGAPAGSPMVQATDSEGNPYFRPAEEGETPIVPGQGAGPQPAVDQRTQELMDIAREFGGQPAVDAYNNPLPADKQREFFINYATSFGDRVAEHFGDTVDIMTGKAAVNVALEGLGQLLDQKPNLELTRAREVFKGLLRKAGMPEPDLESFGGELGREQVDSLIMLAGLRAVAPKMASLKGANWGSRFLKRFGEAMQKHPVLTVANDVLGATPGGVMAARATDDSTVARVGGALAGGGLSNLALKVPRAIGGAFQKGIQTPARGITNPHALPEDAKLFAEAQVEGDLLRIEDSITKSIRSVKRPNETAMQLQSRVYDGLEKAEEIARGVEGQYWNRVKVLNAGVPPDNIVPQIQAWRAEWPRRFNQSEVPIEAMDRLEGLFADMGKSFKTPTVEKLRAEARALGRAIKDEKAKARAGGAVNETLIMNNAKLISLINDGISTQFPTDVTLQQARAMSIEVNNLFTRTIINKILSQTPTGAQTVRPEHTVEALLAANEGLADVMKMSRRMRTTAPWRAIPGVPNPGPTTSTSTLIGAQGHQVLKQLEVDIGNSFRSMVHETIDQARVNGAIDPSKAGTILRQFERMIPSVSKVSARLHTVADELSSHIAERKALDQSALARFAGMDADKAIGFIMSGDNPAAKAAEFMRSAGQNRNAVEGLQSGIIDRVIRLSSANGRLDPQKMQGFLSKPETRRLVEQVWAPGEVGRLDRLVGLAVKLESGELPLTSTAARKALTIFGGIVGAAIGRDIGAITGHNTIQIPGMMAKYGREFVAAKFGKIAIGDFLHEAVKSPEGEKFLLSRSPESVMELNRTTTTAKNVVRTMEAARGVAHQKWEAWALSQGQE